MPAPFLFRYFNLFNHHSNPFYKTKSHLLSRVSVRKYKGQKRNIMTSLGDIEHCKAKAAKLAVDENIDHDCIVGIGSGSTMRYVVERILEISKEKGISVKCIPTSFQSKQLIYQYNLPLTDLDYHPVIDVTIDGADEVDENLVAIKGGGACLAQEKIVAFAAKKFVVVADYRKNSKHLGDNWTKGIPIEVIPMACNAVRHYLCSEFQLKLTDIEIRLAKEKAGPVITDNGNQVIDWKFKFDDPEKLQAVSWRVLSDKVKQVPGVVETGIFAGMIDSAYFGELNGTVNKRLSQRI